MLRPGLSKRLASARPSPGSSNSPLRRGAHVSPSQPAHPQHPPIPPTPAPSTAPSAQYIASLSGPLFSPSSSHSSASSRNASSSAPANSPHGGHGSNGGEEGYYPLAQNKDDEGAQISHDRSSAYPFAADPSYVARYRNPSSRYRDLASYYQPSSSATSSPPPPSSSPPRRTASSPFTEAVGLKPRPRTPPPGFDPTQTSFEARRARLEMERLWEGGQEEVPSLADLRRQRAAFELRRRQAEADLPVSEALEAAVEQAVATPVKVDQALGKTALCFPGSGSQYVGMGSFLSTFPSFERTWEEAEEALSSFEDWRKDIGLEELYMKRYGFTADEARIMGGPMRKGAVRGGIGMVDPTKAHGLRDVVFKGPQDELTRSSNAQPAILITSIAFLRALEEEFATPVSAMASYFLGHSSGEYSACVAAGSLSFPDAVRLTRLHGLLTTRTLERSSLHPYTVRDQPPERRAQMSALVINPGRTYQEVKDVVADLQEGWKNQGDPVAGEGHLVEVASYNSSAQIVLSGSRAGVLEACDELHDRGIANRAADLPVAAPFHCSFMQPAADGMALALSCVPVHAPRKPIISGLTATPVTDPTTLRAHLVGQIPRPVVWSDCIEYLRKEQVKNSIFIGPGRALANLARREGQMGGWVSKDGEPSKAAGRGTNQVGQPSTVKLRTRGGVKQVATPGVAGPGPAQGPKPAEGEYKMEVRAVATEADYGRIRELFDLP